MPIARPGRASVCTKHSSFSAGGPAKNISKAAGILVPETNNSTRQTPQIRQPRAGHSSRVVLLNCCCNMEWLVEGSACPSPVHSRAVFSQSRNNIQPLHPRPVPCIRPCELAVAAHVPSDRVVPCSSIGSSTWRASCPQFTPLPTVRLRHVNPARLRCDPIFSEKRLQARASILKRKSKSRVFRSFVQLVSSGASEASEPDMADVRRFVKNLHSTLTPHKVTLARAHKQSLLGSKASDARAGIAHRTRTINDAKMFGWSERASGTLYPGTFSK